MNVYMPRAMLRRVIEALEHCAHDQAGYSCDDRLFRKEDTIEWKDAQYLRAQLAGREPEEKT